jgi:sec-independent protein translocase protein TatA
VLFKALEGWHLVILAALAVLLFGARRLPSAARSLGQSLRIFKSEVGELSARAEDDAKARADEKAAAPDRQSSKV